MNETINRQVLSRIRPDTHEQQRMKKTADHMISLVDRAASRLGRDDISAILVGSAARGTWISGEHDLDIFIPFPEDTEKEDLKTVGLKIAREAAEHTDKYEERYAEHPYIHATYGDFEIDLVPCFKVQNAACLKSSVDRTPFHNQFILSNIRGHEDDVLLLKQFMKGSGVYGSDLRTGGFSGYLCELLVIHYLSFMEVLKAADDWKPGMTIDIKGHSSMKFDQPLVMIDPTDPCRNVAAALSVDRFARFIDTAREFVEAPALDMFFPPSVLPITWEEFEDVLNRRGTSLLAVVFDKPDVVDDVLYPQLFMLQKSLMDMLKRHDFVVHNADVWADEELAAVVLEMLVSELPPLKKHLGPPVWAKQYAWEFKTKHQSGFSKVYIQNGRYVVDVTRTYTDVTELIKCEIQNCRLGKYTGASIRSGFRVQKGTELLSVGGEGFRSFLKDFLKIK